MAPCCVVGDELKKPSGGICKLCLKPAVLRRSHILPDMAYAGIIEKNLHPRMVIVQDVVEGRISDKTQQTGYREWLLCENCELRFSVYERYASEHFFRAKLTVPTSESDRLVRISGLNYAPLKLYLLSVLWRASVAEGRFFRCVDLGDRHEERLRQMLDAEDPGKADEYGCLITPLLPESFTRVEHLLSMPARTRTDQHNTCLFQYRGFVFHYYVSRHRISPGLRQTFLNEEGGLTMLWARMGNFAPIRGLWNRTVDAIHREKRTQG